MHTVDILEYAHQTLLTSVAGLPDGEWERMGACGVWSVKEIIAHLTSFEAVLVDALRTLNGAARTPLLVRWIEDYENFNDAEVAAYAGYTTAQIIDAYKQYHATAMGLLVRVAADEQKRNGVFEWYGEQYDLEDFLMYTYFGHKLEHTTQITAFRERSLFSVR